MRSKFHSRGQSSQTAVKGQTSIGLARLRFLNIVNRLLQNIPQVEIQDGGHAQKRIQSWIPRSFVPNGISGSRFKSADEGLAQAGLGRKHVHGKTTLAALRAQKAGDFGLDAQSGNVFHPGFLAEKELDSAYH